jgi:hypothetical protein
MKLCDLSPNSYILVSESDLYIPTIGLHILLQETRWTDLRNHWNISVEIRLGSFSSGST